jgi:MoaA/NifB/PqqE/SkfB family radical SAM enzyme
MFRGINLRVFLARARTRGLANTVRVLRFSLLQFLRCSTPRKLANLVLAKVQKWLRRDRLISMPYRYYIDPLNVCNLRCPLCPTGRGELQRPRGKMSLEDFKRLIDQIAPYAYSVELYNWGEPFLHSQIFDMIRYASERKISVQLSSNLNYFSEEMAKQAVTSGLARLLVSVDGATQETYERYRRGGRLEVVIRNLRLLVEAKHRADSSTPFITFRTLINRYNEHEIDQLRHMAADLEVDSFSTGPIFVNTRNKEQVEEWLPEDERLSYYDYSAEHLENVWHCADLWESFTINWDGGIAPCCWLQDPAHDFDNAFTKPLQEIWNGEAYVSSRRVFSLGGPREGSRQTICTRCKGRPEYLIY